MLLYNYVFIFKLKQNFKSKDLKILYKIKTIHKLIYNIHIKHFFAIY